jgi:hypothetical protein
MKKTIKYLLMGSVALIMSVVVMVSCDDDESLPKIDGYNNSNEVGEENLVAHWNFDGTNSERLSSTAPSNTYGTVGFEDGQIGQSLKLTAGTLVYPTIAAINTANALPNFTVSLWVKVKNNKHTASAGATALFALLYQDDTDIWGNINMLAETGAYTPTSDTLLLKPLLKTLLPGGATSLQDNVSTINGTTGNHFFGNDEWSHYVARWNGTTHKFEIFGNGQNIGGYNDRGTTPELSMRVPVRAVFGSLTYSDIGFTAAPTRAIPRATALIDDVRVFNTALTDAEIGALFNLGTAGR